MIFLILTPHIALDARRVSLFESTAIRYAKTDRGSIIGCPVIDVVRIVTVCFRIVCSAGFDSFDFRISAPGERRFPDIPVN
jgi:hypothetical protein